MIAEKKLRLLITGGTGLLGKALVKSVPVGCEVHATHYHNAPPPEGAGRFHLLDVRNNAAVSRLIQRLQPDAIIHTASIGSVDEAERNPDIVRRVNVDGTRNMAQSCRETNTFLAYISSNAVFDGLHPPYSEDSPTQPSNRYGQIKLEAEIVVRELCPSHLIVRPILMYGWPLEGGRENAVTRWLKNLEKGKPVEAAEDIISMPLWVGDCAHAIWEGVLKKRKGIVHLAGADRVSLSRFAQEVCSVFGCDPNLVRPVESKKLIGLAPRPRDTSFSIERMRREFRIEPVGIREGLTLMRERRAVPCGSCS